MTRLALPCALLLALLTACGGGGGGADPQRSPADALAAAKASFDAAGSVHFTLTTDAAPDGGDAVLGADGVLTRQPAFDGSVTVLISGFNAEVPIVAVDGKVYAKLPLTTSFRTIDPAEYGAPDPADFADPDQGISGLLVQLDDLAEDGQERDGNEIITRYSGTLPGTLVSGIIPSAAKDDTFETVVGIDADDRIATLEVTGDFFGGDDVTYELRFDRWDENAEITAP